MITRRKFINNVALSSSAIILPDFIIGGERSSKSLGVALLGLGYYAEHKLAPGLDQTKHCHLAGIVTGTPSKISNWKEKYNLEDPHIYSYENFEEIKNDKSIDIVYIVTPNALHHEYALKAAEAGKHVICEKPMEISAARCKEMVDACESAGVKLQIGYRCQYDPTHLRFMQLGHSKEFGEVKLIEAGFSFYGVDSSNWRFTDASLSGGGPLMDIGVYCIQACCYTMGLNPIKVTAQKFKSFPDKMPGMEESITWQFEFDNGAIASCTCSYVGRHDYIRVTAEKGWYEMQPAYSYDPPKLVINGEPFASSDHHQQATQMDAFALNIHNDTPVIANGEMGWRDMILVEAIYKAAKTGKVVDIKYG